MTDGESAAGGRRLTVCSSSLSTANRKPSTV